VIIFYFPLVAVPFSLPLVLLDPVLPTPVELGWLLAVGVLTQLGQIGLTQGLTRLPAATATAISYVQVLFAGLWGWWIFAEAIDAWTALGAVLILAATMLSLSSGRSGGAGGQRGRSERQH
jgi:drug/metabolite transporter (DMT)-like permease